LAKTRESPTLATHFMLMLQDVDSKKNCGKEELGYASMFQFYLDFFALAVTSTAQCAFCQVRWPCGQKLKSKNTLSDGKKIFLRLFFLCCFRKKTLKLVSLFIFRH